MRVVTSLRKGKSWEFYHSYCEFVIHTITIGERGRGRWRLGKGRQTERKIEADRKTDRNIAKKKRQGKTASNNAEVMLYT